VVLEDVVELLEFEVVEVIFGEALEDAVELLEVVDGVTEVMVELAEEFVERVEEVDDELLLPPGSEVTVVEVVVEKVEVLNLLVAVIP
jgi:hypothetical protein